MLEIFYVQHALGPEVRRISKKKSVQVLGHAFGLKARRIYQWMEPRIFFPSSTLLLSLSPPRANRLLMRGHILKRKGRKTKKGNTKREGMKKKKRQKREEKRNRQYKKNRHIITKRRTHKQKRKQHNKTITENITKHKQLNLTEKQIKWKEKRKTKRKEKHKKKRSKHREIIIIELPSFHILKTLRERFFWQKMDFPFFS